ncbi:MAG: class I SAM-dependent methyltransferase, partial [Lachnospiraceae bacterium]|nr:class I SAM-dependent methyltransferase [Lachnospiraceae bacterium]
MQITLSRRLERLAAYVTEGNRLADIGTDHAYLPIALVQAGRIPSAIAADVNEGPLLRADEHIRTAGLDRQIETRLSDGLSRIRQGEADTVVIAGMGGQLMKKILEGGAHCLTSVSELVLQPQSEISLLRGWLAEHGFCITDEDIVLEEGKYYPLFRAVHGSPEVELSPSELSFGRAAIQRSPQVMLDFLERESQKNRRIMAGLNPAESGQAKRLRELEEVEAWIGHIRMDLTDVQDRSPSG